MWSKEGIDEAMDCFYKEYGRYPLKKELGTKNKLPSQTVFTRNFGSLNKYYENKGIEVKCKKWNEKSIDKAFESFYEDNKRYPLYEELGVKNELPAISPLVRIYGSLNKYYKSRNIDIKCKRWTEESIDKAFDLFFKSTERYPLKEELGTKNNLPSSMPINKIYGNLNKYYISREIEPNNKKWSKKEIDDSMDKFYTKHNRYPLMEELGNINELPSSTPINKMYGGLSNYYISRGLDFNNKKWSKEEINESIDLFYIEHKRYPLKEELGTKNNLPSSMPINRQYGGLIKYYISRGIEPNSKSGISKGEKELLDFIKTLTNKPIYENDRKTLSGLEIDIFIPDLNIAIEYNGDYWHSDDIKDKYYHLNKTKLCEQQGITLIHIFESEWKDNNKEIREYLRTMLNTSVVLYKSKGNTIEIDRMKPIKYSNIKLIQHTKPQLIASGSYNYWNCGTTICEVIK